MKKNVAYVIIVVCVLIAVAGTVAIDWLYKAFGNLTIDEIIFQLKVPMKGTSPQMIWEFLKQCPWKIIVLTTILTFLLIYPIQKNKKSATISMSAIVSILILIISTTRLLVVTDATGYIINQINTSAFIEEEYVNPGDVKILFPEQKRNLIYIFLESMETTYYSKEDGGLSEDDLIPEIAQLAKENLNFSDDTTGIGGAYTPYGTTWTVAAMTAQTAGVPLKISIDDNAMSEYTEFLEGAHGIGEILEENGYHNFLLLGSDATFGGRRNLFTQHGNYEIWDFQSAMQEGREKKKFGGDTQMTNYLNMQKKN